MCVGSTPWALPLYCIEAIAKNWAMTKEDIISPILSGHGNNKSLMPSFDTEIGTYAGVPLHGMVLELKRNGS